MTNYNDEIDDGFIVRSGGRMLYVEQTALTPICSSSQLGDAPDAVFDGNVNTTWRAGETYTGIEGVSWIGADFGAATKAIRKIALAQGPSSANAIETFYAEYWDGAAWQTIALLNFGAREDAVEKIVTLDSNPGGTKFRLRAAGHPDFAWTTQWTVRTLRLYTYEASETSEDGTWLPAFNTGLLGVGAGDFINNTIREAISPYWQGNSGTRIRATIMSGNTLLNLIRAYVGNQKVGVGNTVAYATGSQKKFLWNNGAEGCLIPYGATYQQSDTLEFLWDRTLSKVFAFYFMSYLGTYSSVPVKYMSEAYTEAWSGDYTSQTETSGGSVMGPDGSGFYSWYALATVDVYDQTTILAPILRCLGAASSGLDLTSAISLPFDLSVVSDFVLADTAYGRFMFALSEFLQLVEAHQFSYHDMINSLLNAFDYATPGHVEGVASSFDLASVAQPRLGLFANELLLLDDDLREAWRGLAALQEELKLSPDVLEAKAYVESLFSQFNLVGSPTGQAIARIAEELGMLSSAREAGRFVTAVADLLFASDALDQNFSLSLAETVTLSEGLTELRTLKESVLSALDFSNTPTGMAKVEKLVYEQLTAGDGLTARMRYRMKVQEAMRFIDFLSLKGDC